MVWSDKYDRINVTFEGDVMIFGGHYSIKEAKKIIDEDEYDEPKDYKSVEHLYIRFGLVHTDDYDEAVSGWMVHTEPKKGRIKATQVNKVS